MVDHLMNSTRRVLILAPHTDDAELEDAGVTPVFSPFSHSHDVHTEWAIGGAAITMARWYGIRRSDCHATAALGSILPAGATE